MSSNNSSTLNFNAPIGADASLYPTMVHASSENDAGFAAAIALFATLLALIAGVGICLNVSLVFVTLRAKMHGTCNILLALTSAFEICHQSSHFVFFYVTCFGPRFIDYFLCVKIQTAATFGSNAIQLCLLATAVDRLLSSMFPLFYKRNNDDARRKSLYLCVILAPIFGWGVYSAFFFITHAAKYAGAILTACDISDTFYAEMNSYFFNNTLVLDSIIALLYIVVWIGIRKNVQSSDTQTRLFKSLLTIVCVNVGGYFVNLGMMFVGLRYLPWPWIWYEIQLNGVLLNIAAASNGPILFWISSDYRSAYKSYVLRRPFRADEATNTQTSAPLSSRTIELNRHHIYGRRVSPANMR